MFGVNWKTVKPDGYVHPHEEDGCHFRVLRTIKNAGTTHKRITDYKIRWPEYLSDREFTLDSQGRLRDEQKAIVEFIPMDRDAAQTMRPDLDRLYRVGK